MSYAVFVVREVAHLACAARLGGNSEIGRFGHSASQHILKRRAPEAQCRRTRLSLADSLGVTMATKEPQPRAEGVSLSGAMARQEGSLHHGQGTGVSSTTQRRAAGSAILCERRQLSPTAQRLNPSRETS